MSLEALSSITLERQEARASVAVEAPRPVQLVALDHAILVPASDRCRADWRRPDGYWACVRRVGHRGRHRMRGGSRVA